MKQLKPSKDNFLSPLENQSFLDYINLIKPEYNNPLLYTDNKYLTCVYQDYINFLFEIINKHFKPDFPPLIKVEDFVPRFDGKKSISENRGNAFIIYRKYLIKFLERSGIKLDQKEISTLSGHFWRNESPEVKTCYKDISDKIKQLYRQQITLNFGSTFEKNYEYQPPDGDNDGQFSASI